MRYSYIASSVESCARRSVKRMSTSDRIDRVVTSRLLDLPIFAAIMVLVYHISISTVGDWLTNWIPGRLPAQLPCSDSPARG